MTCIVGIEYKGNVYIGCDSAQSDGHFISAVDSPKIFTTGPLTFGYTTSFRFADLLQYNLSLPARSEDIVDDKQYLVATAVAAIRETLHKGGFSSIENNRESGGTALVIYKNKLYTMQDDFSIVRDTDRYASCGSGRNYALGSLATTQGMKVEAEQRVRLALEAAVKHCATVQGPVEVRKV